MIAFVGTLLRGAFEGIVGALEARDRTEQELAEALEREQVAQFEIERLRLRLKLRDIEAEQAS
jgi:SOS response regulatory protein OraA/RecX